MILNLVSVNEMSISDISKSLNMNPGSVHYHLKELEKHGLVKQVREEIKGGIVKKYYRSAAKRVLLAIPDFNDTPSNELLPFEYIDNLIRSIEYLGYHLPPENEEDAKDLMLRYDKRIKDLLKDMHSSGLEDVEANGFILRDAYHMILSIQSKNDPEMDRIYSEFGKLFLRYE